MKIKKLVILTTAITTIFASGCSINKNSNYTNNELSSLKVIKSNQTDKISNILKLKNHLNLKQQIEILLNDLNFEELNYFYEKNNSLINQGKNKIEMLSQTSSDYIDMYFLRIDQMNSAKIDSNQDEYYEMVENVEKTLQLPHESLELFPDEEQFIQIKSTDLNDIKYYELKILSIQLDSLEYKEEFIRYLNNLDDVEEEIEEIFTEYEKKTNQKVYTK